MKEETTLGFKISCEPKIEPKEDGVLSIVDKILCSRVKSSNEVIVEEIRKIIEENSISDFYGINESKVLQLVKEHRALEIIKRTAMSKGLEALNNLLLLVSFNYKKLSGLDREVNDMKVEENYNLVVKELKATETLKYLFDFDFALRFPTNQHMLRIANKRTNEYWEIPISKEEQDLLKEVLL